MKATLTLIVALSLSACSQLETRTLHAGQVYCTGGDCKKMLDMASSLHSPEMNAAIEAARKGTQ